LLLDETATGLLNRCAVIAPIYSILYARHCDRALNLLNVYGAGCVHVLGPDELNLLPPLLSPSDDMLASFTIPPFFVDDDESQLKEPSTSTARPLHVSFLGAQALMSCSNAIQHVPVSGSLSMSVVGPGNKWAHDHLIHSISSFTCWSVYEKPAICGGNVTLCSNFNALASLEPTAKHFVVCHGELSDAENDYIECLPEGTRILTATDDGYMMRQNGRSMESGILPRRLWKLLISSLYED
jgi:hypothetical protein